MSDADKGRAYSEARREQDRYLDARIPELQSEGKPHPGPSPDSATIEQRMSRVVANAGKSKFPGRVARDVAMQEYAEGARA
jgi:hypothetical protein